MNRKKKIYQKLKKQMMQAKMKKQPVRKPPYITKAERAALALLEPESSEQALQTLETDDVQQNDLQAADSAKV